MVHAPHAASVSTEIQLQILYKEYDTLRAEIIARSESHQKYLTISAAVAAVAATFVSKNNGWSSPGLIGMMVIAGLILISGVMAALASMSHTAIIGRYLRHVERRINNVAGDDLLRWENSYRGPLSGITLEPEERTLKPWYLSKRQGI